jgi:hypothetical protein
VDSSKTEHEVMPITEQANASNKINLAILFIRKSSILLNGSFLLRFLSGKFIKYHLTTGE